MRARPSAGPVLTVVARIAAVLLAASALVLLGRLTVGANGVRADGYRSGHRAGYYSGYSAGLRDGVVQGRQEGRVLQEGETVPGTARDSVQSAFTSGYTAGTNDVFAGYDGGWVPAAAYIVSVQVGRAPIAYRISSRVPVQPGVEYFVCSDGHDLCQAPRR